MNLSQLDLAHIWHPCTQMSDHERVPLIPIKRASGVYLYDFEDRAYIDCISSWWVNLFGHCNEYINNALINQAKNLEHVILAGFSHEPIIRLSSRLCEIVPENLNKCFYADNGSSAIEVALKMSYQYFLNAGERRSKFLSLSNSYHGETFGALSIGNVELYKQTYSDLLLECIHTPVPCGEEFESEIEALKRILQKEGKNINAFILEPLVQCAGNMNMYSNEYIRQACTLCREYGINIIFDEIAVGFGRTGSMFALEQCGISPDFLCLSKGITGGYLPLSVVVTTDSIYERFYAPYSEIQKAFLHSHSYTGNALACSCANAVLDIFEKENVIEKNKALSSFIFEEFSRINAKKASNLRQKGMIIAFDIINTKIQRAGLHVFTEGLKHGLLLRPLGNTIYFMPPYIISKEQISLVAESIDRILGRMG